MKNAGITAVVLAAGDSTRMGSQKLLLPYGGSTVIRHIAETLLETEIDRIVVVVGRDGPKIRKALDGLDIVIRENPDPDLGMLSSVRIGIREAIENKNDVMIFLGDQPFLDISFIQGLLLQFRSGSSVILAPVFQGRRGHPLVIGARYHDKILSRYDDVGLRGLLHEHADEIEEFRADDAWVLEDMDYPEDYQRALKRLEET